MNSLKYRRFFLIFGLITLVFSCKNEEKVLYKPIEPQIIDCKIITSSSTPSIHLTDSSSWVSSSFGKDEIIIIQFFKPILISKIDLNQDKTNYYDEIINIKTFSNNGYIGNFPSDNIIINEKINFLILVIDSTKDFITTNAYLDNKTYKIVLDDLNKKIAISNMTVWANDSTKINLNVLRSSQNKKYNFDNNKITDYSTSRKSVTFKQNGEIIGISSSLNSDTIFYGKISKYQPNQKKYTYEINEFIYNSDEYNKNNVTVNIKFEKNIIETDLLGNYILDFENDFFVDLKTYIPNIVEDIKYATEDNFTKKIIYDCAFALMRYGAAKDLKKASAEFNTQGYRIKIFDSYRPHSAQYKLWEIMPNINFVANPEKGSIHNRGAAIDMTLVDSTGAELDMGTEFDFFGRKAFSINLDLPDNILKNRQLMWSIMNKYGFKQIKTEWWHLSHYSCLTYPISDTNFPCKN